MNKQLYKITFWTLSCLILAAAGCRKVEKNNDFLKTIYSVITSGTLYKEDGSFTSYEYISGTNSVVPGDTLSIAGILGGNDARRVVTIGDSTVEVFNGAHYRLRNTSTQDTIWTDIDYMQCRVPAGVSGNSVPVTVTVNGIPIIAPSLKIVQYTNIPSATDTTLVVQKVAEWLPANPELYSNSDLWEDGTVTNEGNIWFYNQPGGIFKITGQGTAEQVLATGAHITPAAGTPFTIVSIIGFTLDIDETVLYFSASTTEETADTADYYITRLCRMNPASGSIEVLNRSTFMKTTAKYPRADDLTTLLYDPAANYLPAEGSTADTKMALANLFLAMDGTLFASNFAYRMTPFPKSPLAGNPKFPQFSQPAFYAERDSVNASVWYAKGNIVSGMNNFVRIRNGSVRSLAKPNTMWPVPSLAIFTYLNQQISADGKFIYKMDNPSATLQVISTDDFEQETKGAPGYEFSFSSSDSSTATGWHAPNAIFQSANFINFYILSNGDGVFFPGGYGYPGMSLLGINFAANNAYVFAGTEKGLTSNDVPGQDQTTGSAKWVNFSPIRRGNGAKNSFIGFDRKNNLYFVSSADKTVSGQPPLEIYMITKH